MSHNTTTIEYEKKPWGFHATLSDVGHYKVKELVVNAGERLSYQIHKHRAEHWLILEGVALITHEGKEVTVGTGATYFIPANTAHRVENAGVDPLVILEAQFLVGDELSEDDIVRLEDDYDRTEEEVDPFEEKTKEYIVKH